MKISSGNRDKSVNQHEGVCFAKQEQLLLRSGVNEKLVFIKEVRGQTASLSEVRKLVNLTSDSLPWADGLSSDFYY